jgi:hypothetical protein
MYPYYRPNGGTVLLEGTPLDKKPFHGAQKNPSKGYQMHSIVEAVGTQWTVIAAASRETNAPDRQFVVVVVAETWQFMFPLVREVDEELM